MYAERSTSDAELLAMVATHDVGAFRELHDRHAPWLLARLRRRCSNDDIVFDALQDTFVAVWRRAEAWNGSGEPAAWLWGIASRRLIGAQRRRTRWAPVAVVGDDDPAELVDAHTRFVDRSVMSDAIAGLPADLHAVVQATYVVGLTMNEAGAQLDLPPGTVKSRLIRARRRLREVL
jgi:RNA polymerase sigma-70 factor (ECF subfamily)